MTHSASGTVRSVTFAVESVDDIRGGTLPRAQTITAETTYTSPRSPQTNQGRSPSTTDLGGGGLAPPHHSRDRSQTMALGPNGLLPPPPGPPPSSRLRAPTVGGARPALPPKSEMHLGSPTNAGDGGASFFRGGVPASPRPDASAPESAWERKMGLLMNETIDNLLTAEDVDDEKLRQQFMTAEGDGIIDWDAELGERPIGRLSVAGSARFDGTDHLVRIQQEKENLRVQSDMERQALLVKKEAEKKVLLEKIEEEKKQLAQKLEKERQDFQAQLQNQAMQRERELAASQAELVRIQQEIAIGDSKLSQVSGDTDKTLSDAKSRVAQVQQQLEQARKEKEELMERGYDNRTLQQLLAEKNALIDALEQSSLSVRESLALANDSAMKKVEEQRTLLQELHRRQQRVWEELLAKTERVRAARKAAGLPPQSQVTLHTDEGQTEGITGPLANELSSEDRMTKKEIDPNAASALPKPDRRVCSVDENGERQCNMSMACVVM